MTRKQKDSLNTSRRFAIPAKSNELQLDLDSADSLRLHGFYYHLLEREGLTKGWLSSYVPSDTPGHYHCTITMPYSLHIRDRILFQALLGSHLTREVYNFVRSERGAKIPIVFFRATRNRKPVQVKFQIKDT